MRAAWSLVSAMALVLAACKPPAQATPEKRDAPARTGSVSISGDDELARILSWSLPVVALQAGDAVRARAKAQRALAVGDLFETAESAIPLLIALQRLQPDDAGIAFGPGRGRGQCASTPDRMKPT